MYKSTVTDEWYNFICGILFHSNTNWTKSSSKIDDVITRDDVFPSSL